MRELKQLIRTLDRGYIQYLEMMQGLDFLTPISRHEYLIAVLEKYKEEWDDKK